MCEHGALFRRSWDRFLIHLNPDTDEGVTEGDEPYDLSEFSESSDYLRGALWLIIQNVSLGKHDSCKKHYRMFLEDSIVKQPCLKCQHNIAPGVHCVLDVCNISIFRSNEFFMEPDLTLKLTLYQDCKSWWVSKEKNKTKHKMVKLVVYITLGNVEDIHTFPRCISFFLCSIRNYKYFGEQMLYSALLSDLKRSNIHDSFMTAFGQIVRATVWCITGHNY